MHHIRTPLALAVVALLTVLLVGCEKKPDTVSVDFHIIDKHDDPNDCMIRIRDGMRLIWAEDGWERECRKYNNADRYTCDIEVYFCNPTTETMREFMNSELRDTVNEANKVVDELNEKIGVAKKLAPTP